MSAAQTFSTNDLRSASIDYKRFHNSQKWKHGVEFGPGRNDAEHGRPAKLTSRSVSPKPWKPRAHAGKMAQKRAILQDKHQFSASESSADEDIAHESVAPTPAADTIYFSFDSKTGPSVGSQVLNAALTKAIDKFESSAVDRIVKDEYDVLDHEGEVVASPAARKSRKGRGTAAEAKVVVEDDDYEFV